MGKLVIIRTQQINPAPDASYDSFRGVQGQMLGESCGVHPMQSRASLVDKSDLEKSSQMANEQILECVANMITRSEEYMRALVAPIYAEMGIEDKMPLYPFPEQDQQFWKP